ncbi:hypothetical protein [Deinococcus hohokamensis]|uniref:Uncharacterized protein n=1 Tax=Deinococcus hohokamensis TaxID=309883 RepID=A0ABV9I977_9DEIO
MLSSLRSSRAVAVAFLTLLGAASAIRVLPGSPLGPGRPPAAQPVPASPATPSRWENPTVELLITVRALLDLSRRDPQALNGSAVQVARVLDPLGRQRTLSSAQATAILEATDRALGGAGQRALAEARQRLEQRVQMELASSRYARGEDTPGMATFRLALLVPGGQGTVAALARDATFNPFRQGVPSSTLRALLVTLKR